MSEPSTQRKSSAHRGAAVPGESGIAGEPGAQRGKSVAAGQGTRTGTPAEPDTRRTASRKTTAKRERLDGALVIALSRSYEIAHRESRKLVAEYGITFSQFEVLEALMHKGPLTVNAIIEAVLSTGGNITVVVRNLEKLGYVTRRANPDDGRSFIVELTASGSKLIEKLFPLHMELLDAALASLTDDDIETVIGLLKKVGPAHSTERKAQA